ncbi:MAG: NifB/NifX family molybdenum-iron cluster-binding protein [Verrucomicrobiota bacterium]|nr:NifB/NifX family molybdenum-iron cluster-binding protein [Verrucomicrobiota bacterium]
MTVALPVSNGRISPVLDAAVRLLVVTRRRGEEIGRSELLLGQLSSSELARKVAELGVDVLLCAAVSESLLQELEANGVRVERHLCGDIEEVLKAFSCGRLWQPQFRMPGCWSGIGGRGCCRRHRLRRGHVNPEGANRTLSNHNEPKKDSLI